MSKKEKRTLLVVSTLKGEVLGSFTSTDWAMQEPGQHHRRMQYFGTGEAFLFMFEKRKLQSAPPQKLPSLPPLLPPPPLPSLELTSTYRVSDISKSKPGGLTSEGPLAHYMPLMPRSGSAESVDTAEENPATGGGGGGSGRSDSGDAGRSGTRASTHPPLPQAACSEAMPHDRPSASAQLPDVAAPPSAMEAPLLLPPPLPSPPGARAGTPTVEGPAHPLLLPPPPPTEGNVRVFPWTSRNGLVMLATGSALALGGGGGDFGLYLDDDLSRGTTGACETFGNAPLCSQDQFEVACVELWGFTAL
jgi:hypothetical protein